MTQTSKHGLSASSPDEPIKEPPEKVTLGYGAGRLPFQFDPEQFLLLAPPDAKSHRLTDGEINAAMDSPIGTQRLEEIIKPKQRVVIVVPDATRAAGIDRIASIVVDKLNRIGSLDEDISILIGGGTHRPPTSAEIESILGPDLPQRIAIYPHNSNDASAHAWLGQTSRGTKVHLNRRLMESDHVVVLGAISYHYIAGFSGGPKGILPGCGARSSIQSTHLLSFDCETLEQKSGVGSGCLDGNPFQEDITEAVAFLDPSFLVNTVLGTGGEVIAAYAGHWRKAHRLGCRDYARDHTVREAQLRPVVIVSAGGAPRDINLIQSHKAIEHAALVLEEGGTMIVLAQCPDGLGLDSFLRWFVPAGSKGTAKLLVDNYQIYGQTAWSLRRKAERFRILLVSSLEPNTVRQMGLEPHPSFESALAAVSKQSGYIIPGGLTTLPALAET